MRCATAVKETKNVTFPQPSEVILKKKKKNISSGKSLTDVFMSIYEKKIQKKA